MCRCACSWRYVELQNPCDWDFLKPKNSRNHWHEAIIHRPLLRKSYGAAKAPFFSSISEVLPVRWFGYHDTNVFLLKIKFKRIVLWHIDTRNPAHNPWSANHRICRTPLETERARPYSGWQLVVVCCMRKCGELEMLRWLVGMDFVDEMRRAVVSKCFVLEPQHQLILAFE